MRVEGEHYDRARFREELVKGKSSIEIDGTYQLVPALELIKQAVEAGELDALIEVAANKLREGFAK